MQVSSLASFGNHASSASIQCLILQHAVLIDMSVKDRLELPEEGCLSQLHT